MSISRKRAASNIAPILGDNKPRFCDVPCCVCGTMIQPNQTNMCVNCLKGEVDICADVGKSAVIANCRDCGRYQRPPWTHCELESRELLGICLKKIKGINTPGGPKLVDASFVWTEPHSKRLKVKLTLQKEIINGAVMQQSVIVELVVQSLQCDDCQRTYTPHTWNSVVQVRQKTDHKRTFFFLEQLILKHDAHEKVVGVKKVPDGLDFNFGHRSHAMRFADFVTSLFPGKTRLSKHLISHDANSNTYNYKYSILCDLCPVCRDDLVFLPPALRQKLGGVPPLMLVSKVSTTVHLVDAVTARTQEVAAVEYWKLPFQAVLTRRHMQEFVVLDVDEHVPQPSQHRKMQRGGKRAPGAEPRLRDAGYLLVDLTIARKSDLGMNDEQITVRSHLGRQLTAGDVVLGYDMRTVNVSGLDDELLSKIKQEVIVVKKVFQRKEGKQRKWKLRRLADEGMMVDADDKPIRVKEGQEIMGEEEELEEFKRDLEEDKDFRQHVQLFKDEKAPETEEEEEESEDEDLKIDISELLENLTLDPKKREGEGEMEEDDDEL